MKEICKLVVVVVTQLFGDEKKREETRNKENDFPFNFRKLNKTFPFTVGFLITEFDFMSKNVILLYHQWGELYFDKAWVGNCGSLYMKPSTERKNE